MGLLGALIVTVIAIFYPLDQDDEAVLTPPIRRPAKLVGQRTFASVEPSGDLIVENYTDPFAPRGWQPPPVAIVSSPTPPPIVPIMVGPPAPVMPAGPPSLPFRFAGRMNDGGAEVVYLERGEQILLARTGETLDGIYKIMSIDAGHIEFEHLPTREKQVRSRPSAEN